MTQNQISYMKMLEDTRSHRANEALGRDELAETTRSHRANEAETARHNIAGERETNRHNVQTEAISWGNLAETTRHNQSTESLEAERNAETARHNVQTEAETRRHNKFGELEARRLNDSTIGLNEQKAESEKTLQDLRNAQADSTRYDQYYKTLTVPQIGANLDLTYAQTGKAEADKLAAMANAGKTRVDAKLIQAKTNTEKVNLTRNKIGVVKDIVDIGNTAMDTGLKGVRSIGEVIDWFRN